MNRDIHEAFINAVLSAASYSRGLRSGVTGEELRDALDAELTGPLSTYVAENFDVLAQYPNNSGVIDAERGFSVTVFQERSSGQIYLSFRGTEGFFSQDVLSDIDLGAISGVAFQQVRAMANWFIRATTPDGSPAVQAGDTLVTVNGQPQLATFTVPGTGELSAVSGLVVNGHSLGGHLATAFSRLFSQRVVGSYTYNSAGFLDRAETMFRLLETSLQLGPTLFPGSIQRNFYAKNGLSVATNDQWFNQFGQRIPVFNERGLALSNHDVYKLTDALALFDVMGIIDSQLTFVEANRIADASSRDARASLETTLDALRRLMRASDLDATQVGDAPGLAASRIDYHAKLADVRGLVQANPLLHGRIVSLADKAAAEIVSLANVDVGYRYALMTLNPFAVVGAVDLYATHATDGRYDLYRPQVREGQLTHQWIADRAAMFAWLMRVNIADGDVALRSDRIETYQFVDKTAHTGNGEELTITVVGRQPLYINSPAKVTFGGDNPETISGGDVLAGDRLYGGGGDDTLIGHGGPDYLEGGVGFDSYVYSSGDGMDRIVDIDGRGQVLFNGTQVMGGYQLDQRTYASEDLRFYYSIDGDLASGATLTINGQISIEGYRNGDLGIVLTPDTPLEDRRLTMNIVTGVAGATDMNDRFFVSTGGGQLFFARGGDDVSTVISSEVTVQAGDSGNDVLTAGDSEDYLYGGPGRDLVYGGGGPDLIYGDIDQFVFSNQAEAESLRFRHYYEFDWGETYSFEYDQSLSRGYYWLHNYLGEPRTFVDGWLGALRFFLGVSGDEGPSYDDILDGGAGDDTIRAGWGADEVYGGDGDDDLVGDNGVVRIGEGEIEAADWQVIERLLGVAGSDYINGGDGDDRLGGMQGNDTLLGEEGDDFISGGQGDDVLDGGEGSDRYHYRFGDGTDFIYDSGASGIDVIEFGLGITEDMVRWDAENSRIAVGDQYIYVYRTTPEAGAAASVIEVIDLRGRRMPWGTFAPDSVSLRGTDSSEELRGTAGADTLEGLGGADILDGAAGDDLLDGGASDDALQGGLGNDTYLFGRGSGRDSIIDVGGNDAIVLGADIVSSDLMVIRGDEQLTIAIRGSDDRVTVQWRPEDGYAIEAIRFHQGNAWDATTLLDRVNDAPVAATPLAPRRTLEDEPFTMRVPSETFTDADAWGSLRYAASLADGRALPAWLDFDPTTQTFSGTPGNDDVGEYALRVTATDQDGLSAATAFTLTVSNVNDRPVLAAGIPAATAVEDEPFRMVVPQNAFIDPDIGDRLILHATLSDGSPLPAWVSFDAQTGIFSGTPLNGDVGVRSVRVTATDREGAAASADFSVTVSNVNDAPELRGALPDARAYQNARFEYRIAPDTFVDVDAGDRVVLAARLADGAALPAWLRFDPSSSVFTGTPGETQTGLYDVEVTATDAAGARAADIFRIAVSDASDVNTVQSGTRRSDTIRTGFTNDLIQGGEGDDAIDSGAGRDLVYGGAGKDDLALGYGNDIAFGGSGKDRIRGGDGNDFLVGGEGDDRLEGEAGNDVLTGGAGKDILSGGAGNNLLIGGAGDSLYGGDGRDVFAFNSRDGKNTVYGGDASITGNRDTISLGGGISASDIVLRRKGSDLIVAATAGGEESEEGNVSVILKDWYENGSRRTISRLQVIGDRVEVYDFAALVARYDAVTRGKNDTWRAGAAMPDTRLAASADEAIGGMLAYQYARGRLGTVAITSLHATTSAAAFGETLQRVANDASETLAAYYALDVEHDDERAHDDDREDDDRSERPVQQQARTGISANAYTSALLAFHMTGSEAEKDAEQGYTSGRSAVIPVLGGSALSGVPSFVDRSRAELRAFSGLPEPLLNAA